MILGPPCVNCGAPLTPEAQFCAQCGAPVQSAEASPLRRFVPHALAEKMLAERGAIEGARRNVTLMFADIAGFTALARAMDPRPRP